MADQRPPRRIDDPQVLKALTHPLRQRLFRLLAQLGPATVGTLAERAGGDPGQISYHLRELAKGGFIEQAPELARDRRETWWRMVPESTSWSREDFRSAEGLAVFDTVTHQMLADQYERLRRFTQTAEQWDQQWQRASVSHQSFLYLTAAELSEMVGEFQELAERWGAVSQAARDAEQTETRERAVAEAREPAAAETREPVLAVFHAFPDKD